LKRQFFNWVRLITLPWLMREFHTVILVRLDFPHCFILPADDGDDALYLVFPQSPSIVFHQFRPCYANAGAQSTVAALSTLPLEFPIVSNYARFPSEVSKWSLQAALQTDTPRNAELPYTLLTVQTGLTAALLSMQLCMQ
jgi:hypothetical protein